MVSRSAVESVAHSPWYQGVNPEQASVIAHDKGPACVLAGAGAGKTEALGRRVARLVDEGADPTRILAVTFSKDAAAEMTARFKRLGAPRASASTWHSLCYRVLREDGSEYAQWKLDSTDQHRALVKQAMGWQYVKWANGDVNKVCGYIGLAKANLMGPEQSESMARSIFGFGDAKKAIQVFAVSEELVAALMILTFDDLLLRTYEHLCIEENRQRWSQTWDYLLQDEAQDANLVQVTLAKMLAWEHRNYMIIGDPAQAIYAFRGSSPSYLTAFAKEWKAPTYCMNRNYRSGRAVIQVANDTIRQAEVRLPLDIVADRDLEGVVTVTRSADLDDEAGDLVARVMATSVDGGAYSDWAVLYRTNAQSRAIEEACIGNKIPYMIMGGCSFYERREVKNLLAYLRVAADADPTGDAMKRSINAPFRYLGAKFVEKVMEVRSESSQPWTTCVRDAADLAGIQSRQADSAEEWSSMIEATAKGIADAKQPSDLLADIISRTAYEQWVTKDEGEDSIDSSRIANVRELRRVAERFATVADLLTFIDEQIAARKEQQKDKTTNSVLLMSVHKSKGLEWPRVWVVGCNETILPHARGNAQEERRLFYVASTRARDELNFSYVASVAGRRGRIDLQPSRFLEEAGLIDAA